MKQNSIIISFYNSYPITSGSSAVTTALFNSWPGKKKLFLMNHEIKIKKKIFIILKLNLINLSLNLYI